MLSVLPQTVYHAFGLRLSGGIRLPELPVTGNVVDRSDTDIVIEMSAEPNQLWEELEKGGNNFVRKDNRFLFLIPDTAAFCIEDGHKIMVSPFPGADEEKVRVYLLGTCMGALLMMRRVLPLHGSAVEIDGKAYAFVGDSGAGKSTLAAALVGMSHQLVSDDVIAVRLADDGTPMVTPSYPQQKLWQESIDHLGLQSAHYRPVYRETTKYAVPVSSRFCSEPVPLAGVFELVKSERDTIGIRRLPNLERLRMMLLHTYRNVLIRRLGLEQWHFKMSTAIADRTQVYELQRPVEGFTAHHLASAVIERLDKESR